MIHPISSASPSQVSPRPVKRAAMGRRAFVTITAVTLIGLVAVAMTAIVAAAGADARRTRESAREAQLRQLLLAAAADAKSRSAGWAAAPPAQPWEITLPDELTQQGDHVTVTPEAMSRALNAGANAAEIRIEAGMPGAQGSESLQFTKTPATWRLNEAILEGMVVDNSRRSPP